MCIVISIGESQLFLKSRKASPRNGQYQEKMKGGEHYRSPNKTSGSFNCKTKLAFLNIFDSLGHQLKFR